MKRCTVLLVLLSALAFGCLNDIEEAPLELSHRLILFEATSEAEPKRSSPD